MCVIIARVYSNVREKYSIEMLGKPKACIPKRKDEIRLNGNGTKVEKSCKIAHG